MTRQTQFSHKYANSPSWNTYRDLWIRSQSLLRSMKFHLFAMQFYEVLCRITYSQNACFATLLLHVKDYKWRLTWNTLFTAQALKVYMCYPYTAEIKLSSSKSLNKEENCIKEFFVVGYFCYFVTLLSFISSASL